ncbi:efflux transporter outer membrane subunit [Candidiatus Paracoxiella cheracis]|uniref:efflux transporter outer membrane subunit n=1 Tax=Candidiatus Paracoxiella cheracis TaxID=3405120 RepID=UPI003BF58897
MRNSIAFIFILTASLTLVGCEVGPDFHSPAPPKTTSYTKLPLPKITASVPEAGNPGKAQYLKLGQDIPAQWWHLFHSPAINALIRTGLANSPTLASALATLHQSQQLLRATIGNLLFPSIDLEALAERTRTSSLGFGVSSGSSALGNAANTNTVGGNTPSVFSLYYTAATVSYTLDIWGGLRRQVEAMRAQVDLARYQLIAAYLSLTSNIVTTAITVATLQEEIHATRELIKETAQQLQIVKEQLKLGGASAEDVLIQETQLSQTEALLPPLQVQLAQARHALAVLVGQLPSQSHLPVLQLNLVNLPAKIPISVPSKLINHRPDVQQAEALLHEASANIGVATANLLPQINLSAGYGYLSTSLNTLFTPTNNLWSLAADLLQPIFHGTALIAQRRAAIDAFEAACQQYQETVLTAFQNVADALRALEIDAREYKAQQKAEISARSTYIVTKNRFKLGGKNYLDVLIAEQAYQKTRINRIKAEGQRFNDTAALFQALGGGWWNVKEYYGKQK